MTNRVITLENIQPSYAESLRTTATWMCDLVRDNQTRRLPFELCLPPRESTFQVLNAPDSPWIRSGNILGVGIDSINIQLSKQNHSMRFRIPSEEELFEEMIVESGLSPIKDEKRTRYNQAIPRWPL